MSIQKSVGVMTGHFSSPFGDKKQYTTFISNGCQFFIALEPKQEIPVDIEIRGIFELEHKPVVENNKVAGSLRPSRFIRQEKLNSAPAENKK